MTHAGTATPQPPRAPVRPRFGCCVNMIATTTDPVAAAAIETVRELGFDYVEFSLRDVVALAPAARSDFERRLARAGIAGEACNNFFPAEVRLTGPNVDPVVVRRYAEQAFGVASSLGAAVVVFGSSAARNVPAGYPMDIARRQLRDLLLMLAPIAERHGLTIAIEHLCRAESNILNRLAESRRLADEVAHPRVRVLVDAYHHRQENEPPTAVAELGERIAHVHIAEGADRVFPTGNDPILAGIFRQLQAVNYAGRISIEAYTRDFAADATRALRACRALARGS